jgi:hypothetical protein
VDKCLENIQKSFIKLKWLNRNGDISKQVSRTCFFAYSFPFFTWLFPFFPPLPAMQQELIKRKYRSGLQIVHRCLFARATEIFSLTKEKPIEHYVCRYLRKRLSKAHRTDLGHSSFYQDVFYWDQFNNHRSNMKRKKDSLRVGHFFRLSRVKNIKKKHQLYLLEWLSFIDKFKVK